MSTLVRIPPPALVSVSSFSFGSGVLHQTELRARAEVGVLVRALRRLVTELGLYGLDGVTGCRGLAGHRVTANLVVPELSEPECLLHGSL